MFREILEAVVNESVNTQKEFKKVVGAYASNMVIVEENSKYAFAIAVHVGENINGIEKVSKIEEVGKTKIQYYVAKGKITKSSLMKNFDYTEDEFSELLTT